MNEIELINRIVIGQLPGVGPVYSKALITCFGSATNLFALKSSDFKNADGVKPSLIPILSSVSEMANRKEVAKREVEFLRKSNIEVIQFDSDDYPQRLKEAEDSPHLLYKKGKGTVNNQKTIAIVGARKATSYGREFTDHLVETLAPYQVNIVSGLAHGIDSYAHRSALKYNTPTTAILGHGLDQIYPANHRNLAVDILKSGSLMTEFTNNTPIHPSNFPKRNRIVAGMADAVIIVEAAIKGGALVTAKIAATYQKEIYAVPGRTNDPYSKGCNHLIKNHNAILLDDPQELPMELGWEKFDLQKKFKKNILMDGINQQEKIIINTLLNHQSISADQIAEITKIPNSIVYISLLSLEIKNKVRSLPGSVYEISAM